jgi:nucleoside-diphosphate-sugar epimerase
VVEISLSQKLILVTGANGFVGQALCAALVKQGFSVRAAVRDSAKFKIAGCEIVILPSMEEDIDWTNTLVDVDTIIHLAARVHVMQDNASNPLHEFRKVNLYATEHLAKSAAAKNVKRLVYVSSIKVNGEETVEGCKFTEQSRPAPQDPYGISKYEAELSLNKIASESALEVVIVRPPLVYGPGVKGNFAQMVSMIKKGIPLPFLAVNNLRSLIYIDNFVSALILCAVHADATGKTFLVSDGDDVSTADLIKRLGVSLGRPARLFALPLSILKAVGFLFGKSSQIERLIGSLQIDSTKIREELGWKPQVTVYKGLELTAKNLRID